MKYYIAASKFLLGVAIGGTLGFFFGLPGVAIAAFTGIPFGFWIANGLEAK